MRISGTFVSLASLVLTAGYVAAQPAIELSDKPITAKLAGGGSHRYSVAARAGQLVAIEADQQGIDVVLAAVFGNQSSEADAVTGSRGLERVLVIAAEAGIISVVIRTVDSGSIGGQYSVRISESHDATDRDRARIEAQRLTAQAEATFERRTSTSTTDAISILERAVEAWRQTSDEHGELNALLGFSRMLRPVGRHRELLQYSKRALNIARKLQERASEAVALNQVGLATALLGDVQEGVEMLEQVLALWRSMRNPHGEAYVLNQIGGVYFNAGDVQKTIPYYRKTLELSRALNERELLSGALISMGTTLCETGHPAEGAKLLEEALVLYRVAKDEGNQSVVLQSAAGCYRDLNEAAKALTSLEQALALSRRAGRTTAVATALGSLGSHYLSTGDIERARTTQREVLELRRQMGLPGAEAIAQVRLAQVELQAGNLDEALSLSSAAIDLLESVRSRIGARDTRAARIATSQHVYGTQIEILRRLDQLRPGKGYAAQAFETSELARARGLLDLLNEARVDVQEGVPEDLLRKERSLSLALQSKAAEQRSAASRKPDPAQREATAEQFRTLISAYEANHAKILKASARYATLAAPRPPPVSQIQKDLLDPDTLLIEYFLGANESCVWVVTQDDVAMVPLGATKEIAGAAAATYRALVARQPRTGEPLSERTARIERARTEFMKSSAALSELVLGPVRRYLDHRRWLIVAHGPLHYVPFAALPLPGAGGASPDRVVERHEVVYLPSASVAGLIRAEHRQRRPAERLLAVLADPVFEAADQRLTGDRVASGRSAASRTRTIERLADVSPLEGPEPGWQVSRLPFTRREAAAIVAVAPDSGARLATDFDASRELVLSGELASYRYIHFATHGFYDSDFPELSGIVLSLFDRRGRPVNGFFRLHDIYNLKLNADLVVLSACQTGLGKHVSGEGLIGLTRGMLYAGASRVGASLWNVDDAATAEIMQHFYAGMLREKISAAAALRAAQLRMLRTKRWSDPWFWAAFVIQGDPQ